MADVPPAVQQVIQSLNILYQDPDPIAKEKANAWLSEFQKSNEAWATSQLILFAPGAPLEGQLFAAQTFRTKISYDLAQLPPAHRLPLRDSLLTAVRTFASGPRVVLTQVCIALADLALQLNATEWADPTTSMIELFGKEPVMAGALLEFLQVIAEEYCSNLKLDVRDDFGRGGKGPDGVVRGMAQAEQVVGLLSMYVSAPGITPALQNQCFLCLGAWLRAGQAPAISIKGTAILSSAFAALTNDELFDDAVSFLVDVIHETQELDDNVELIQEIMPQLIALRPQLLDPETREDEDKMRGLCRILVEAGEWYERLILRHQASFLPLVELIALCAEYDNLEVVGITLNFWYRLSRGLREVREDPANQPLLDIYSRLVATIIRHLHYPDDADSLQGQERDDFRNFRHTIGDTLKDCCSVLGAVACLTRSYEIISSTLALAGTGTVKWQDLEAPLFSMRSMGAEVDPADNEIMPRIMELLPSLPSHPKIRYAAILVIGRYTRWIDYHPEHIQFQLPYVSSGFEDSDVEVSAASAQTMKYLCKDCSHHLVPFLPQLHNFIQTVESKLGAQDLLDLAAAIAHIIAVMPPVDAPQALSTFCMPIVEIVHSVANKSTPATKDELRSACDALERLSTYLSIVDHFEGGLPRECEGTCVQIWTVLDAFLAKYGGDAKVAEKTCVAIRRGLTFFGDAAFRVAPAILDRLAGSFVGAPASSYLWITAKMIGLFAGRRDAVFGEMMQSAVDRESAHVHALLQRSPPSLLSDVLDDYAHLLNDVISDAPSVLFLSPTFPGAVQSTLSTLTLLTPQTVLAALDVIRSIIGHDSLQYDPSDPSMAAYITVYPAYAQAIRTVVDAVSFQLVGILLDSLVAALEDTTSNVLTVFRMLSVQFPNQLAAGIPSAVEGLSSKVLSTEEKNEFLSKFQSALGAQNPNQVKEAFTWLLRTSKKSRERARLSESRR